MKNSQKSQPCNWLAASLVRGTLLIAVSAVVSVLLGVMDPGVAAAKNAKPTRSTTIALTPDERNVVVIVWIRAEDQRVGGGPTEIIRHNPVRVKAGICEGFQCDLSDRRVAVARRKGVDNALFSLIASLTITVKYRVGKVGVEFGEDISDEDGVIRDVAGALIRDRDGPGSAADCHRPIKNRVERIAGDNDRHRALGKVGHIEQRAIRRQSTAARLGTHVELRHLRVPI
jgi:hypothetical protein